MRRRLPFVQALAPEQPSRQTSTFGRQFRRRSEAQPTVRLPAACSGTDPDIPSVPTDEPDSRLPASRPLFLY